jgi:hypothetical protein
VNAGAPAGVSSSCSTGGTCLVTLVTNTVISHEGGNVNMVNLKYRIVSPSSNYGFSNFSSEKNHFVDIIEKSI